MTQVAHGVGGGGTGRSGASLPLRIHELLLSLAGRLDDDALADARQMLASTELDRSLEFVAGCLVAGKVVLTGRQQQELEALYADTYLDVSLLDRVIARDRVDTGRHKFATGAVAHREPDHGVADTIRPVLDVLPDVRSVWCVWRVSPAGPSSGSVPHRVVLIGVGPGGFAPATAYRVEDALRRAGVRASVEVLVDGVEPPEYHKEAMSCARQVPFADAGRGGPAADVALPAAQESRRDDAQHRPPEEPGWRGEPSAVHEEPAPPRSSATEAARVEVSRANPPWMDAPRAEATRAEPFGDGSHSEPLPTRESRGEQSRGQEMPSEPFAERSRSQLMPASEPLAEQSRSQLMPAPEPFGERSRSQMAPAPEPLAEQSRSQMAPAPEPFGEQSRSRAMPPEPFAERSRSQMAPAPEPLAEQSRSQMTPPPEPLAEQSRSRAMPPPESFGEQSRSRAFPRQDPHAEQSRSRAMPPPERPSGFGERADAPKLPSSPVEPPWRDAPKVEPARSALGEPARRGDESDSERTIIEPLKAIDPQYRQEPPDEPSDKPRPSPKPKPTQQQPPSALNVDTPTGSTPAPRPPRPNPAAEDKQVDRHSAAFGDDMLNTQERNLLKELQDELARREQSGSQSGAWQIDKSGRHGKPASAGPFDQPTNMTRPVITNGKPRPEQRGGY